jgi:hypothetical protein
MRTRPLAAAAAAAVVVVLGACSGGEGPPKEELAAFCRANDELGKVDTSYDKSDPTAAQAALDRQVAALDKLRDAAPASLGDEFASIKRYGGLTPVEQALQTERKRYDDALDTVDAYVEDNC